MLFSRIYSLIVQLLIKFRKQTVEAIINWLWLCQMDTYFDLIDLSDRGIVKQSCRH